jgi:AcrR family transcriptional regulator
VYRYFSGKEELIAAIVGEVLGSVRAAFEEAAGQYPPPPPDLLVGAVLGRTLATRASLTIDGEPAFPRLVVQVWSETVRNPKLATVLREGYEAVGGAWERIVAGYQDAGMMRADLPAEHVARTMIATVIGFVAQLSLFGPLPVEALQNGLRALMSMSVPESGSGTDHGSVNVLETRSN